MFWRITIIVILGLLDIALLGRMLLSDTGLLEYMQLKNQLAGLREEIVQLDAENRALSREIRLLQTDSQYAEKMVRQHLHYLRDNEIVYIFASSSRKNAGAKANVGKN